MCVRVYQNLCLTSPTRQCCLPWLVSSLTVVLKNQIPLRTCLNCWRNTTFIHMTLAFRYTSLQIIEDDLPFFCSLSPDGVEALSFSFSFSFSRSRFLLALLSCFDFLQSFFLIYLKCTISILPKDYHYFLQTHYYKTQWIWIMKQCMYKTCRWKHKH